MLYGGIFEALFPFGAQPGCGGQEELCKDKRADTKAGSVKKKKASLGLPPLVALENSHHPVGGHMEGASILPNYKWGLAAALTEPNSI